ncbi:uncharacterized protein KY384_000859 [Bacidia gigantensis]|uniref:uncharacterized protein n=1 Tax=Bacidia gigantensis TaxID=2732470 RepID=UPI001D04DD6A|nr:uncharacterized protein KY384_000859 [Bacidia gigantensis]KAG8534017.1 hypothetical protein KY384_000859 [Bacidia gigantensis]
MAWTSTHGIGAILGSGSKFNIAVKPGFALITPSDASQLSGEIHFQIPRPPKGYNSVYAIKLEFSSQSASVDSFAVYIGNKNKQSESNLQWTTTEQSRFANVLALGEESGIEVVIGISFDAIGSLLKFQSVDVKYD